MALYSVTVSWLPCNSNMYFQGFLSFSTLVFADDRDDAREEVVRFCAENFNAKNIVNCRIVKS